MLKIVERNVIIFDAAHLANVSQNYIKYWVKKYQNIVVMDLSSIKNIPCNTSKNL